MDDESGESMSKQIKVQCEESVKNLKIEGNER